MSNAAEGMYTRYREFKMLMYRAEASLGPGKKFVFVHQVAEHAMFSLYELSRSAAGPAKLRCLCRDRPKLTGEARARFISFQKFVPSGDGGFNRCGSKGRDEAYQHQDPVFYFTHFDVWLGAIERPPSCQRFIRKRASGKAPSP